MRQLKVLLIVGEENSAKADVLRSINQKYNVQVTKRVSTDESLNKYSDLYDPITIDDFSYYLAKEEGEMIRTFDSSNNGLCANVNTNVGASVCEMLNGKTDAVVLNIGFKELPFYMDNYRGVSVIGCLDEHSDLYSYVKEISDGIVFTKDTDFDIFDEFLGVESGKAIIKK